MKKNQILSELGDIPEAVYDGLVAEAFAQGARQLSELRQLAVDGDLNKAAAVAHSMKGCFANLRLGEVSRAARELESALKGGAQYGELSARINSLAALLPPGD